MAVPRPENEETRLAALYDLQILDTPVEREFDDITLLASQLCGTPIAVISLIDESRQWFMSRVGLDVPETPREQAFCSYAILDPTEVMIVKDATDDERFSHNPLVTSEPQIRFYAGAPLLTPEKLPLGTLCVIDNKPRELSPQQLAALNALARQVSLRLELKRTTEQLRRANESLQDLSLKDDLTELYNRRGFFLHAAQQFKLFRSRRSERSLWLMVGDIDGLKQINDQFGHTEGSAAIKKAAEILTMTFRDADILARLGGDEFVALILNTLDEVALKIPERLAVNLASHNANSGLPYDLEISIGLAKAGVDDTNDILDLINEADAKMYENKRNRKEEPNQTGRS